MRCSPAVAALFVGRNANRPSVTCCVVLVRRRSTPPRCAPPLAARFARRGHLVWSRLIRLRIRSPCPREAGSPGLTSLLVNERIVEEKATPGSATVVAGRAARAGVQGRPPSNRARNGCRLRNPLRHEINAALLRLVDRAEGGVLRETPRLHWRERILLSPIRGSSLPAEEKQGVADRLGVESLSFVSPQKLIAGIDGRVLRRGLVSIAGRRATAPRSGRCISLTDQPEATKRSAR